MNVPAHDQDPHAWSEGADGYDREFAPVTSPYATDALDLLGVGPGTRLVDVGAGSGAVALAAAARGADVLATDFAPGMIDVLRRRAAAAHLETGRIEAQVMDGQALDLDDDSFDAGVSMFGLIFFPRLDAGVRELARVVRPGGKVAIGAWRVDGFRLVALNIAAFSEALGAAAPEPPPPTWARVGDASGMRELLQANGLHDVDVHVVARPFRPADPEQFFRRQPTWSPPVRPLFESLDPSIIDQAAAAFARLIEAENAGDGVTFDVVIGVGHVV
jgi:SAM-dependent methyltransferase